MGTEVHVPTIYDGVPTTLLSNYTGPLGTLSLVSPIVGLRMCVTDINVYVSGSSSGAGSILWQWSAGPTPIWYVNYTATPAYFHWSGLVVVTWGVAMTINNNSSSQTMSATACGFVQS